MTSSGDSSQKPHTPEDATTEGEPLWTKSGAGAFGLVFLGLLLGFSGSTFLHSDSTNTPLRLAMGSVGLWLGLALVPGYLLVARSGTLTRSLGLRFKAKDLLIGIAVGVACQFVLLPLLYLPVRLLSPSAYQSISAPAENLTDGLSALGKVAIVVIAGFLAPLIEELFFRGFAFKVFAERFSAAVTIVITAVVFGIYHFQELQTIGLVAVGLVFAYMRFRSGRLGPSIVAHIAFNCAALTALLLT